MPGTAASLLLFAVAAFLAAWQLFLVQPMVAKMVLPRLGGSPSVWNGCMLFFQAALLLGYGYAHALASRFNARTQAGIHAGVLIAAGLALPLALPAGWAPPAMGSPLAALLGVLAVTAGAPFAALAATAPLIQRWFATTDHPRASDPYFLYAAGNAGSLAALLAYPFAVEPTLPLSGPGLSQGMLWTCGYAAAAALVAACGVMAWRRPSARPERPREAAPSIEWRTRIRWMAFAFVPSSLVLGATQFLTTDVAAIPLLWVLPLALYLASFVAAFSPRTVIPERVWSYALAALAAAAAFGFWAFARPYVWLMVILHPLLVFAAGRVLHGRLAAERPTPARLTEFYLLIGLGGVLGGAFNTLVAPLVFRNVFEYPLMIVAACLLRPAPPAPTGRRASRARWLDAALPAGLLAVTLVLPWIVEKSGSESNVVAVIVQAGVPSVLCLALIGRPLRFAVGLAVLLLVGGYQAGYRGDVLHAERTFFGVHRVFRRDSPPFRITEPSGEARVFRVPLHILYHGATRHGIQPEDPRLRRIPTSYYHPNGPIGQVFRAYDERGLLDHVAVIGLGAGTLAAYGDTSRVFTFYEIDPAVVRIARDPRWFTFLQDSRSVENFVLGDGRLSIAKAPDGTFGLIVVDAFSSDAIPVHLLTREAVALYMSKLKPGGLLALHLTNQALDLGLVVNAIATDLSLPGLFQENGLENEQEMLESKDLSAWAVLARRRDDLAPLASDPRWEKIPWTAGKPADPRHLWTDAYSSVFAVLR